MLKLTLKDDEEDADDTIELDDDDDDSSCEENVTVKIQWKHQIKRYQSKPVNILGFIFLRDFTTFECFV